jgi:hypothetical protein
VCLKQARLEADVKLIDQITLPRFFAAPMFLALMLKSGADAFFEVNSVKYLYFFLLLFGVFFLRTGRGFERTHSQPSEGDLQSRLWVFVVVYFAFLTMVMMFNNGSPQMIFKIVSPFIYFGLLVAACDKSMAFGIALGALLNVVANAATVPFEFGWVYWGAVHTFKGFYLFKTDLAYSLTTSLLVFAAWLRFRMTPILIAVTLGVVAMVVLANSRMNYVTLGIVLGYIAYRNGTKLTSMIMALMMLAVTGGIVAVLWDSQHFLNFDTSNMGGFTQGRDRIVEVLIKYGLATYTPVELLFGRGLYADQLIYMENVSDGLAHGAHNDYLFQLVSQGVTGVVLNIIGWVLVYNIAVSRGHRRWAKGLIFISFLIYLIQGLSVVASLFALKTWPLATLLALVYASPDSEEDLQADADRAMARKRKPTAVSLV